MKHQVISILIGSLLSVPALAGSYGGKSSSDVVAEHVRAQESGDFVVNAETGDRAFEADRSAHPARPAVSGKTRAQVLAELLEARRIGDFVVNAETGEKALELNPDAYPARPALAHEPRMRERNL